MLSGIFEIVDAFLKKINLFRVKWIRKYFWELRAHDIDKKWGNANLDFDTVKQVVLQTNAKKILDFGCGSGRLFPLYEQLKIEEVVGQDISSNAINLIREKFPNGKQILLSGDVTKLDFTEKYFDLVISNRALSAVHKMDVSRVIDKLCFIGKHVYINEFSDNEKDSSESSYWFKHDYPQLFMANDYRLVKEGFIKETGQFWQLYSDYKTSTNSNSD